MTTGFMGPYQYGYASAPGANGAYGYYQQDTPLGAFAAANQQYAQYGQPAAQQTAVNPWIGQQSTGIAGAQSVLPYAQQVAGAAQQANPYIGQQSAQAQQVGANAFGGGNPFLGQAIDAASADAIRNYDTAIRPQLDSMARASGSFGNTAIQELQQNAMGDLGRNLGNIANSARMQDYTQQQQLAENALNRQQSTNQFNASLGAQDLNRNTAGFFTGQQIGLQGLNSLLGAAQFDAGNALGAQQFNASLGAQDLNRNAQLAQSLAQFNAGQGNALNQFNAQLGQQNAQFNTAQGNALNQFNAGQGNQMLSQQRQLAQQQGQFDDTFDLQSWQANNQVQRQGQQDQLALLNSLLGLNQQYGIGNATNVQNSPLNYWQQFSNSAAQLGGLGGTQSQNLQGNPLLGAIGGWQLAGNLFGS